MEPEQPESRDLEQESAPRQEYERYAQASDSDVSEDPDVVLDVPVLNVEELELEVERLKIEVAVQAELSDVVKLTVGVNADLGEVKLAAKGVEAQALLKAKLENTRAILEQAFRSIDRDPSIIERLAGGGRGEARKGGEEDGRTVQRTVDEFGNVLRTVLDGSGEVVEEDASGSLADLPVEEEYVDDEDRIVGLTRDDAGNVVEVELDESGNVVGILNFTEGGEAELGGIEATAPAARVARELGVDLTAVNGTGSGGRILVKDVKRAAQNDG